MIGRIRAVLGRFDWVLLLAVLVLVVIGLATIWSVSLARDPGDLGLVKRQAIAAILGLALVFFLAATNYRLLKNYSLLIGIVALVLLVLVLITGSTVRGTTGWLRIAGWNFQPVEFAKFALIVFLAKYFADHPRGAFGLSAFSISSLAVGVTLMLVLLEPDLGSGLVLLATWIGLLASARIRKRYLVALVVLAALAAVTSWFFLAPYQKDRILTFLDAGRDPLGRGYNVLQATIAVGAGEAFGRGLGFGSQSQLRFLPESHTDFIFAVIAEEFGFLGVLVVLASLGVIFMRILHIAKTASDDFTAFFALGTLFVFGIQFVINVGMNLGLLPVAGIGLPFLSYGGSALLMSLVILGVIQSIAVRRPLVGSVESRF